MKLSVFAVLLAAKPFDEACKYLANAGVQAVEIGCGGFPGKAHCDPKEFLAHPEKIDEMLATLKKYNLEIAALSTHGNCVHPNPEVARQFEEDYENTILLAEKMGVEMPICECAYGVLYEGKPVQSVLSELMGRRKRREVDESWI